MMAMEGSMPAICVMSTDVSLNNRSPARAASPQADCLPPPGR
eukprot:CAMPEP_0175431094 /NCGR_PEP_ID=MMETSP0095-20121207/52200_1 /TAXON_ID=311494 /ORGANISM="Alexandrium monilatum, Strain CCMP3105" /LENGTH=41 /DNA_ID= /DNA_START= /DNA_END= /DNA_ORIENTATION=